MQFLQVEHGRTLGELKDEIKFLRQRNAGAWPRGATAWLACRCSLRAHFYARHAVRTHPHKRHCLPCLDSGLVVLLSTGLDPENEVWHGEWERAVCYRHERKTRANSAGVRTDTQPPLSPVSLQILRCRLQ